MKIEKRTIAYFTPSQVTRKYVYNVAAGMGNGTPTAQINLTGLRERKNKFTLGKNEVLIAAVPSFGGRVPKVAPELFSNIYGDGTPAAAIVTFGGRAYDDTLIELQNILRKQGFVTVAGAALVAKHSLSPDIIEKGRPDEIDLLQAREFGISLKDKLENNENFDEISLPGQFPYVAKGVDMPIAPITTDECVLCMQCYRWCPTDAILWNDPNETEIDKCILCHGCVVRCPVQARKIADAAFNEKLAGLEESLKNSHCQPEFFI